MQPACGLDAHLPAGPHLWPPHPPPPPSADPTPPWYLPLQISNNVTLLHNAASRSGGALYVDGAVQALRLQVLGQGGPWPAWPGLATPCWVCTARAHQALSLHWTACSSPKCNTRHAHRAATTVITVAIQQPHRSRAATHYDAARFEPLLQQQHIPAEFGFRPGGRWRRQGGAAFQCPLLE